VSDASENQALREEIASLQRMLMLQGRQSKVDIQPRDYSSGYESKQYLSKKPREVLCALGESSDERLTDSSPPRAVLRSEEDALHQQYLREKPLLEEIRLLRVERDRVMSKMVTLELEN